MRFSIITPLSFINYRQSFFKQSKTNLSISELTSICQETIDYHQSLYPKHPIKQITFLGNIALDKKIQKTKSLLSIPIMPLSINSQKIAFKSPLSTPLHHPDQWPLLS